jgi:hypothetical protein
MKRFRLDLPAPTNQWAFVIYLLIENKTMGVTMVTAMKDHFHKFQTRLGELEVGRKDKLKIRRLPITQKNRFGHVHTFLNYKSVASIYYLRGLYKKINAQGMRKDKIAKV